MSLQGNGWKKNDGSIVEKCKTWMEETLKYLEISTNCHFNFKDQRFSHETGLGRGFLASKLGKVPWTYPYDINLHTGIFCRIPNVKSLYSLNLCKFMGEKSLGSYSRVQSHHSWHCRSPLFIREGWRGC